MIFSGESELFGRAMSRNLLTIWLEVPRIGPQAGGFWVLIGKAGHAKTRNLDSSYLWVCGAVGARPQRSARFQVV